MSKVEQDQGMIFTDLTFAQTEEAVQYQKLSHQLEVLIRLKTFGSQLPIDRKFHARQAAKTIYQLPLAWEQFKIEALRSQYPDTKGQDFVHARELEKSHIERIQQQMRLAGKASGIVTFADIMPESGKIGMGITDYNHWGKPVTSSTMYTARPIFQVLGIIHINDVDTMWREVNYTFHPLAAFRQRGKDIIPETDLNLEYVLKSKDTCASLESQICIQSTFK